MGRSGRIEQERQEKEGQRMRETGTFWQRGMGRRVWSGGLAAGLCLIGAAAQPMMGQFSGPALTLPTQANPPEVPTDNTALLDTHEHDVQIGVGDVLSIRIFESPDFNPTVKVSIDGTIQIPLIGVVPVAGLTVEGAENLIAQRLEAEGMFKNPQVTVELTAAVNQFATITGEIHAVVPLVGVRRLFDVLAAASPGAGGGQTVNANIESGFTGNGSGWPSTASHIVTVIRRGVAQPIVIDIGTDPAKVASANIVIFPHDLIVISKVGVVYVVGAFAKQGAIPLDQNTPLTLLEATALSGGAGFEGRFEDLRVIRTEGLERKVVKVDIKAIERGKAPDPVLQADDIVFLPTNAVKGALKNGGIGTLIGLADVALLAIER
jgi:polysaccharide export outer membrane protein